jgi:hypothetical protein
MNVGSSFIHRFEKNQNQKRCFCDYWTALEFNELCSVRFNIKSGRICAFDDRKKYKQGGSKV